MASGDRGGTQELRVFHTLSARPRPWDVVIAAVVHVAVWGGAMVVGPLSVLCVPLAFLLLPLRPAVALAAVVAALCRMPELPESPAFCRLYLRVAALLPGGSTLWVEDACLSEISEGAMVCYHPHGVIPWGFTLNGAVRWKTQHKDYSNPEMKLTHRLSGVQAPALFKVPILRQFLQLFGCTTPATKQGMRRLLSKRMTFGIVVGGSEEVALHVRGRERLFLKKRAGFLKYAMQFGFKVVIAYNFGESDLYSNVRLVGPLNLWLVKRFGFVLPIFCGRWWCPLLPRGGVGLNTVFGELLQLPRIDEPTAEQVEEWHGRYVEAVVRLFERHKSRFGYGDRQLEVL